MPLFKYWKVGAHIARVIEKPWTEEQQDIAVVLRSGLASRVSVRSPVLLSIGNVGRDVVMLRMEIM